MTDHGRKDFEERQEEERRKILHWRQRVRAHGLDPDEIEKAQEDIRQLAYARSKVKYLEEKVAKIPEIYRRHFR